MVSNGRCVCERSLYVSLCFRLLSPFFFQIQVRFHKISKWLSRSYWYNKCLRIFGLFSNVLNKYKNMKGIISRQSQARQYTTTTRYWKRTIQNTARFRGLLKGKRDRGKPCGVYSFWSSQKTKIFQLTRNLLSKIVFENEEMIVAVCLSDSKSINSIDIGKHASTCTISLCKCPS